MSAPANPGRVLSFTDHLEELRVRLIICLVYFVIAFAVSIVFAPRIVEWLIAPLTNLEAPGAAHEVVLRLRPDGQIVYAGVAQNGGATAAVPLTTSTLAGVATSRFRLELPFGQPPIEAGDSKGHSRLFYLSPVEPVMLLIKGALLASATATIPMVVYQLWLFIAPGLMQRERRTVKWILASSLLLFPAGALFAYVISQVCLKFLLAFGDQIPGLTANIVASKYVGFILALMIIFGIVFEFPLALVLLSRLGVIDSAWLGKKRRVAIVIMALVAAVATPSPDPFSMVAMLIPLIGLYEGSIWAIRLLERAEKRDRALLLNSESV